MSRRMTLAAALGVLLFCPLAANAALLTLTEVAANDPLQQQTNNPCVLGGNDCNSRKTPEISDFTQTPTGNSGDGVINWDLTSPGYTVGAIRLLFGDNFFVGLDFSQAQGQPTQVLGLFAMTVNGVAQDIYLGPTEVPPTDGGNAGNGFADYVLKGFDISSFGALDIVRFHAIMPVANDGPDQAFLIRNVVVNPCPVEPCVPNPNIPEPTSMALLGAGLFGVAVKLRRRR